MTSTSVRFMLTVPNDLAERAEVLKKELYYNKPYAEMYRQLIKIGIKTLEQSHAMSPTALINSEG